MFQDHPCWVKCFWDTFGDIPTLGSLAMKLMLELDHLGEIRDEWQAETGDKGQGTGAGLQSVG